MSNQAGTVDPRFEARFSTWVVASRWPIIITALLLVALASSGILFLKTSTNYRMFFSEDNPQLIALELLENTYGKNDNVLFMVVPENGDFASELALSATAWLTEQAWQTPHSRRVDSVVNFQHTTADGDDLFVRDLVDPLKLGDPDERARIRATALAEPRLAGKLVAADGGVSAVNVTVEMPPEDEAEIVPVVAEFMYDLTAEAEKRFPGIEIRFAGTVVINHAFSTASIDSQKTFLPVSLVLMALILGLLTRGISGVAATGAVIIFSVLVSMGLGGWVGLPFTPPTAPAPTIVLMIVVANCVHLLVATQQHLSQGMSKNTAIAESLRLNLSPVFLASLTTALGFLAMNFSEVPPYRHLGTFVAFGIVASFFLSITFLPALLSLLPMKARARREQRTTAMAALAAFVVRRRTFLLWGMTAIALMLIAAIPRNELNDVLVHFFDESVEFRQDSDFLDEHLSGSTIIDYSLASSGPGAISDPAYLEDLAAFADWYRAQPETRHVMSISDTFRRLNQSMHGDDPDAYRLPTNRDLAAQYLLLYELSLPLGLDLNNQIDVSKSATRLSVTAKTLSSREVLELHARAMTWLRDHAPHLTQVQAAGPSLMFAHIGQRNIRAMLLGTIVALLGISFFLIVALRSLRLGLVSLVPNLIPGAMGFGIWGLAIGEVGLALSVVLAMTIGIVVDDTVHFLSKYRRARNEHGASPDEAVRAAFQTAGQALFTTSVVLVSGFLILALSPFIPTMQVGLLTALIISFALFADLLLLPPLLMAVDRAAPAKTEPA